MVACRDYRGCAPARFRLFHFFAQSFAFGLCSLHNRHRVCTMQWRGLVTPTYAALRGRIAACEEVLDFLDAVAMHPQARSIVAGAKADLDNVSRQLTTVYRQLTRRSPVTALGCFEASLSLVETRVEVVREAIAAGGPLALPLVIDRR